MYRREKLFGSIVAGLTFATMVGATEACVMHTTPAPGNVGTTTPSFDWRVRKAASPIPGFFRQEFYANVGLFGPSSPTTCACGFGYSGTPLAGLIPIDSSLVVYDSSTDMQVNYTTFPTLLPNSGATAAFNANPGGAGLNWFGFSTPGGAVPPIPVGPVLGPNQTLQLCIRFDVPIPIDQIFKARSGCLLGAEADPNGVPLPFPQFPHGLNPNDQPFGPLWKTLPTPGAVPLLGMGLLLLSRRRR